MLETAPPGVPVFPTSPFVKAARVSLSVSQLNSLRIPAGGPHVVLEVEALQNEKTRSVFRLRSDKFHPPFIAKHCPAEDAATDLDQELAGEWLAVVHTLGDQAPARSALKARSCDSHGHFVTNGPRIIALDGAISGRRAAVLDGAKFTGYGVVPSLRLCRRKWLWLDETSVVQ